MRPTAEERHATCVRLRVILHQRAKVNFPELLLVFGEWRKIDPFVDLAILSFNVGAEELLAEQPPLPLEKTPTLLGRPFQGVYEPFGEVDDETPDELQPESHLRV